MRSSRYIGPALLAVGLLASSIGWYHSATGGSDQRFESCRFDGDTLVLSYFYGANQVVSPSVDTTGPDVVVALHVKWGGGVTPAVGLIGDARFGIFGGQSTVRYPDGEVLDCTPS